MSAAAYAQAPVKPNADALWSGLHQATKRCFDDYLGADAVQRSAAQKRLLLALELGWKLEELVLLPAMKEGDIKLRVDTLLIYEEIEKLRDLAELVQAGKLDPAANIVVLGALEGIAGLRSVRIQQALEAAQSINCGVNKAVLSTEMEDMLKRWREEIATTGDIEDEERDPVGLSPR
ncbi:MAG TPA: hypothetical protein VGM81_13620 [Burkholderiaceae bacterium]|jgi:hypothetical protein